MKKCVLKLVLCLIIVLGLIQPSSLIAGNTASKSSKVAVTKAQTAMVIPTQGILYQNNFEKGNTDGWLLQDGWTVNKDKNNTSLTASSIYNRPSAYLLPSVSWSDYTFKCRFKVNGRMNINLRDSFNRIPFESAEILTPWLNYELIISANEIFLNKRVEHDRTVLFNGRQKMKTNDFNLLTVTLNKNNIKIYLNDKLVVNYTDRESPFLTGGVSFELENGSKAEIDDILINGTGYRQENKWVKTGGPFGGIGYDVRIHPQNKNIMFVTDLFSGVNKSINGGKTWTQKNSGIYIRTGSSLDAIPIFSLTIDPNNPDIVWAGSKSMKGIFKSVDGGESWMKMDSGVTETREITFRGFAVMPGNSNVVLAAAEILSDVLGVNYDRAKGKIYRSTDGGKSWKSVWEGGSLARVLIINPKDPNIVYCSTGIFDREAFNLSGEGVIKSTDGGQTWFNVNSGLQNLFVGFLDMHPTDPDTLICAVGNITYKEGNGIYRTTDGGKTWSLLLGNSGEQFSVATFSKSNPNVIYAGSAQAFYRSDDGGKNWNTYSKPIEACYGPPGIRAGIPVSAAVDPNDSMIVYVNNYAGGIIKSIDGGKTWEDQSKGYTGEDSYKITVSNQNPNVIYYVGKSGVFKSSDKGERWEGLQYGIITSDWQDIAVNPANDKDVLLSDEFSATLYHSLDGGFNWTKVFHKEGTGNEPDTRHGFRNVVFAPSNPNIVYAGMRKEKKAIDGYLKKGSSFGMYKSSDGGLTWKEINSGLEKADNNINCIAVHPKNQNIVYIGTYRDGIFMTTDGGEKWVSVSNGLMSEDVRSLSIDVYNPDTLYAGLGAGVGLYKTTNGGKEWKPANGGILVECPSYLQRIGQVNPGISLEKPKRTADTDYINMPWTLISSVIVDPKQKNTLYISDYHLGVYISTDGGKSWLPLNGGLNVKAVTSLSISKDGSILYATTSGGGVSRLELKK